MNSINRLGIQVALIVAIGIIVLFFAIKGVQRAFSPETAENTDITRQSLSQSEHESYFDSSEYLDPYQDLGITNPEILSSLTTGSGVAVTDTHTGKYLSTLPDDAEASEILNLKQLEAFVDKHRGVLLEDVPEDSFTTTNASGKEAIREYLESISSVHNENISQVTSEDIERAYRALTNTGNSTDFELILSQLEKNISTIKSTPAPEEVKNLHRHLIAASQALLKNTTLLRNAPTDFVGSLIGAKNIEELGIEFDKIAAQVRQLEEKYDL